MYDSVSQDHTREYSDVFRSGRFWMWLWTLALCAMLGWGVATFVWWMDSVRNLNALSIAALWLACAAGFQATLGMRKADPDDDY
jgi:endonuclease/exonuclease/phosphatase (EEP) superfamily protein YafD